MFPGDLLESTYTDPNNLEVILGRSEVERRREYIGLLEKEFRDGEHHPFVQMVKQCLQNAPSRRPTTEQVLDRVRSEGEGPYEKYAELDAVRQVAMIKEIIRKDKEVENILAAKDRQIQLLQEQHQV